MASLLSGTTIGGYTAVHSNNISSYALTSVPANVITTSGGQTIAGITYFSNGESLNLYGIRGRFTNEYIHLYNKVGIGHPSGWGQGQAETPSQGLSTYGGMAIAYGTGATSTFYGRIDAAYSSDRYQMSFRGGAGNYWWITNDSDKLGIHLNGTGDRIYFATDGNIWSAYYNDWLSNVLANKQNSSTAITTSNIGSQSVNYANSAGSAGQVSGVAISGAQATALKKTLDPATLPYSCDIYVEGDANTYYPVHFIWGDQDVWRRIIIKRGYGEEAPWDPIGTGAHHGGLLLDWEGNFGGWGGAEYSDRLRVFNESYTNVCADMYIYTHSMGYVFMLRGGHALYHIYSDQEIRGFNQVGTPDIAYNTTSTYFYENSGAPQYNVRPPAPVTSINSSRIDGLRTKKQSLLDGRYLRQGVDIGSIANISATNFMAANAFYLNGQSYYLNSYNGGIYTNARFETAGNLHVSGSSQFNGNVQWFSGTSAIGLENQSTFARFAFNKLTFWDWNNGYDVMTIDGGYVESATSFRAPIFYDSQDTGYYVDPNSTSRQYRINFDYLYYAPDTNYGFAATSVYADTVNSGYDSDPLELVYVRGSGVNIGTSGGNKPLRSGYLRSNGNWGGGDYSAEQFTIRGSSPSITFRDTGHGSKWLMHIDSGNVNFYYGGGVDDNSWGRKFFIPTDGNIWMSWAGDYISNLLGAKQNASTAITTSNIGSQSVNYANSAGNSTNLDGRSSSRYLYYRGINAASDFQTYQSSEGVIRFDQINDINSHSNAPGGYTYGGVLSMRGDNFGFQLWGAHTGEFWFKTQWNNDQYSGWKYVVHSGNIGGMSVSYATTAGNTNSISNSTGNGHTWTGQNYFRTNNGGYLGSLSSAPLQAYSDNNNSAYMSFHKGGHYAVNFGLDADNVIRLGGWSAASNRMQLDMSGNVTFAGDVTAYSDARVKTNVKTLENALDKTLKLRGVSYNRTDSDDTSTKIGVIAQEILEVVPEVVNQDNDGMYNVSYGNITALLIEAIKEQQKQIEELKSVINGLTK